MTALPRRLVLPAVVFCMLLFLTPCLAATTERVSVSSAQEEGNSYSYSGSISTDGRYVAFWSIATNLVENDTNKYSDVFVRDRLAGTTERVSLSSAGEEGNSGSVDASVSADGRHVAFGSDATNLVPDDTNGVGDIFVRDRLAGTTERVSVSSAGAEGNNWSEAPSISADSRYVAFASHATNLVEDDTNGVGDVFVRDRLMGTTERVSISSAGAEADAESRSPSISADGRYVAFGSPATNLVPDDTNGVGDIFVRDRLAGTTERVSLSSAGEEGNSGSVGASVSADGRYVAFSSSATNLVEDDTNGLNDVFVRNRLGQTTERVSVSSAGAEGNGVSYNPSVGADGRHIAFYSGAWNLVEGDTGWWFDVFVRDRVTGDTKRVSVNSEGAEGNNNSRYPFISADSRFVGFWSEASNLVPDDTNASPDVFVRGPTLIPVPQVLLEVHPNERGQGPQTTSLKPGAAYWTWPAPTGAGSYPWKTYKFGGSASLWVQVCAQAYAASQNLANNGFANEDMLKMVIDGVTPSDVSGIQSGAVGKAQWRGSVDQGKRLELEFCLLGLTPGAHTLNLSASMCPTIYWVKVYDLEPRYAEP